MPKLDYLQQKKLNPADELREILNNLEAYLPKIKLLDTQEAPGLLQALDQANRLFHQFEAADLDLSPEQGRFKSLQARLQKQAAPLLRAVGGAAALAAHRPASASPSETWWWYIDALVGQKRRQLQRQLALIVGLILAAIGGLMVLFRTVLAPAPEVLARLEAEEKAYSAIDAGNYPEALASLEQGLLKAPGDPSLLLLQGVVQEALGEAAAAAASFEQALARLNDPLDFYLSRSQLHLRLGQPDQAEADARTATALDEKSAAAWLLLAQALEFQNKLAEAVPAYLKASELAVESGDSEVVVLARMALGRIGASP